MPEFSVFAHDARGHGMSTGGEHGHRPGFAASVRHLDAFVATSARRTAWRRRSVEGRGGQH